MAAGILVTGASCFAAKKWKYLGILKRNDRCKHVSDLPEAKHSLGILETADLTGAACRHLASDVGYGPRLCDPAQQNCKDTKRFVLTLC